MAVLNAADRISVVVAVAKELFVKAKATATFNTDGLRTAVNETDDWIDSNQASYVASLSEPFASASAAQKTILFAIVAFKRAGLI